MLSKTHIAIVLCFVLVALSYVENKIVFAMKCNNRAGVSCKIFEGNGIE